MVSVAQAAEGCDEHQVSRSEFTAVLKHLYCMQVEEASRKALLAQQKAAERRFQQLKEKAKQEEARHAKPTARQAHCQHARKQQQGIMASRQCRVSSFRAGWTRGLSSWRCAWLNTADNCPWCRKQAEAANAKQAQSKLLGKNGERAKLSFSLAK